MSVKLVQLIYLVLDSDSSIVLIEIKTGTADHSTVGQIQAYIEAMQERNKGKMVRGLVIAQRINDGYIYSLKASKLGKSIEFISLSNFEENIYNIYLEIANKENSYQFFINTSLIKKKKKRETLDTLQLIKKTHNEAEFIISEEDQKQIFL
jgi:RecB family endonuclease NucS